MTAPVRIDTPNYVITMLRPLAVFRSCIPSGAGRLLHPYGFSFAVDNVTESPTDAELGASANWSMVYDTKNIPLGGVHQQRIGIRSNLWQRLVICL